MAQIPVTAQTDVPIRAQNITTSGPENPVRFTQDDDVRLVVQDARRAEIWLDQKQWPLQWRETDILYQSPRTYETWDDGTRKANVSRFTVAKHLNSLAPTCMSGIFYQDPPFVMRPSPDVTQESIRAKLALYAALLRRIKFKAQCELGIESQILKGTGLYKYGHTTTKTRERHFQPKEAPVRIALPVGGESVVHSESSDEFDIVDVLITEWLPTFEYCPIGRLLIDPGWRHPNQVWKAKYIVDVLYLDFYAVNELRDDPAYFREGTTTSYIPAEEELKKFWEEPQAATVNDSNLHRVKSGNAIVHSPAARDEITSEDPLMKPMKVLERWDDVWVRTVMVDGQGGELLLRKQLHGFRHKPFLSGNWWNIDDSGYGLGLGKTTGADQRVEQGVLNALIDMVSMWLNQQFMRSESANIPTQNIRARLGGIMTVQGDVEKAGKWMEGPKIPPETWAAIQNARANSESVSGADEAFVQGQISSKQGASRTATGAARVDGASAARIQGPVGRFVDNVFIEFLYELDYMVKEHMPMSQIRRIIGKELGKAFQFDSKEFLNSESQFEVLAGAHLAAKKAMAQALPFIIPMLENQQLIQQLNQMGYKVNVKELFDMIWEMSEWKNTRDVIQLMSDQEKQNWQANNPALQKIKSDQASEDAKFDNQAALVDQKGKVLLARDLVKMFLEGKLKLKDLEALAGGQGAPGSPAPGGGGGGGPEGGRNNPANLVMTAPQRAAGFEERVGYEHAIQNGPFAVE